MNFQQSLSKDLFTLLEIQSETGNEQQITAWLEQRLSKLQNYRLVKQGQCRGYFSKVNPNLPTIALYGHTDTVKNQQEFEVKIQADKIYGCGASDMKSGLAVMIQLLENSDSALNAQFNLQFVFYDAEEGPYEANGLELALAQMPELKTANFAFVLEPTNNEIQAGCLGSLNVRIRCLGKSAHSARPWQGTNAIHAAGELITAFSKQKPKTVLVNNLPFYEVSQLTLAQGGQGKNLVPAVFELNLNHRFAPNKTVEKAWQNIKDSIKSSFLVELADSAPPGPVFMDNPLLSAFQQNAKVGMHPKQAWTDVARLSQAGIQAVNFGPGDPALAHQRNEYVCLEALYSNYQKLASFFFNKPE